MDRPIQYICIKESQYRNPTRYAQVVDTVARF